MVQAAPYLCVLLTIVISMFVRYILLSTMLHAYTEGERLHLLNYMQGGGC